MQNSPSFLIQIDLLLFLAFLMTACNNNITAPNEPPDGNSEDQILVEAFPNLSFTNPLNIQHAGDQTNRLFVEEQGGMIYVFEKDSATTEKSVFLDISDKITDTGSEQGLLGLAFHPECETNGTFYVNYTAAGSGRTIISRFSVSDDDPNRADPNSEVEILSYAQPFPNHNGGHLAFGPDGYLYISAGDGGGAGDPDENAQNRSTLLGSILRIDIDNPQNGKPYGIPADNPFAKNEEGFREEIFAYGLRNPWRFSFDPETENLWAGDVGQNNIEEIHIVENGLNYGWNIIEGSNCFSPSSGCDKIGLELPVHEYSHSTGGRSITGGYVYRGTSLPELKGLYIYADFVSGRIWALNPSNMNDPDNTFLHRADFNISSFGVDQNNELYICGFDGKIYRFGEDVVNQL